MHLHDALLFCGILAGLWCLRRRRCPSDQRMAETKRAWWAQSREGRP